MIAKRNPEVASEVVHKLSQEEPLEGCLLGSTQLPAHWTGKAFIGGVDVHDGKRPPQWSVRDPASGHTAGSIRLLPS